MISNLIKKRFCLRGKISSNFQGIQYYKQTVSKDKLKIKQHQSSLDHDKEHEEEMKESTENFLNVINDIDNSGEKDESRSIEQYLKIFNNKVYKQNIELTNKIQSIFTDQSTPENENIKTFLAISEINKININNTTKLLRLFLVEVLKSNQNKSNTGKDKSKGNAFMYILLSINSVLLGMILYLLFSYSKNRLRNLSQNILNSLLNIEDNLKSNKLLKEQLVILVEHQISNILKDNFTKNNLFVFGERNSGKSVSLIKYAQSEILKGNLVIYCNLFDSFCSEEIKSEIDLIKNSLINNLIQKGSFNNAELIKSLNSTDRNNFSIILDEISQLKGEKKRQLLILDNFTTKDSHLLSFIEQLNNRGFKVIISSNNSIEVRENIYKNNLTSYHIDYLDTKREDIIKNITENKKKYVFYSDEIEKLIRNNINNSNLFEIYQSLKIPSFSINSFIETQENQLRNELFSLKINNPEAFDHLSYLLSNKKTLSLKYSHLFESKSWFKYSEDFKALLNHNLLQKVYLEISKKN